MMDAFIRIEVDVGIILFYCSLLFNSYTEKLFQSICHNSNEKLANNTKICFLYWHEANEKLISQFVKILRRGTWGINCIDT